MSSFLKSNRDTTDVQILEKINRGDLEVFRYMYLEYYSSLCIYARKFTGTKESAEEIVQDVFIS
jgi:DNA-directed RNA polymerase specialized sigma24 family protein